MQALETTNSGGHESGNAAAPSHPTNSDKTPNAVSEHADRIAQMTEALRAAFGHKGGTSDKLDAAAALSAAGFRAADILEDLDEAMEAAQ